MRINDWLWRMTQIEMARPDRLLLTNISAPETTPTPSQTPRLEGEHVAAIATSDCHVPKTDTLTGQPSKTAHVHESDGLLYTTYPPQVKCRICGELKMVGQSMMRYRWS